MEGCDVIRMGCNTANDRNDETTTCSTPVGNRSAPKGRGGNIEELLDAQEQRIILKVEEVLELVNDIAGAIVASPPPQQLPFAIRPPPYRDQVQLTSGFTPSKLFDGTRAEVFELPPDIAHPNHLPETEAAPKRTEAWGVDVTASDGAPSVGPTLSEAAETEEGVSTMMSVMSVKNRIKPKLSDYKRDIEKSKETARRSRKFVRVSVASIGELDIFHKSFAEQLTAFVTSRVFELCVCFVILSNAVVIGVEVDWDIRNAGQDTLPVFIGFNYFFLVVFTVELLLRVMNERCTFFSHINHRFRWNVFDSILVLSALVEEVISNVMSSSPDMSAMRLLRTFRLVRGFRLVRVLSFFKDLRVMLAGIAHSLQSLVWAVLLLAAMMFLFSVCVMQFLSEEAALRAEGKTSSESLSDVEFDELLGYYGGTLPTIYTLWRSICGGIDWGDAADPLLSLNPLLCVAFCFYIAFAVLCVLNIITGVFVENANRLTAQDDEMVMMEQMETRMKWFSDVEELFNAADVDGSGQLDIHEFSEKMQDMSLQAWFRRIGVQVEAYSAQGLFHLLDYDGDGQLDLDEFALALQSVHGPARSIDIAKIAHECRAVRRTVGGIEDTVKTILSRLKSDTSNVAPGLAELNLFYPHRETANPNCLDCEV